ncbi:glycosyltransferase family 2 protein [Swingsia samuiensis]|uniref:Fucolectin tachylectin-4 pentraxin-1 n=1 Tax=Swingsia samuiensis TaxID=1293412 RepID=A0A4Y6UIU1_9PROT|nr:glycosyltransferase family 2 protein [Swingsia samuiensis]QDH16984.1 fucolectin tachylectin-4 pentraxin-1 [Swingsia samuiensis]
MDDLINYKQTPKAVAQNKGEWPSPKYKYSIVTTARWETAYIKEWIAYHLSIGFEHFYIYCNDDDPSELYRELSPLIIEKNSKITFLHYGIKGAQYQMFLHYLYNYSHETKWYIFLDVDEFICLKGVNNIRKFVEHHVKKYNDFDALYFNWSLYGTSGFKKRPKGDVLNNYTHREEGLSPLTKILTKARAFSYREFFLKPHEAIHHNIMNVSPDMRGINVLGADMRNYYDDFPNRIWAYLKDGDNMQQILDVGYIAHFNVKSEQDFELRYNRGVAGNFIQQKQWISMNQLERNIFLTLTNKVEDRYLSDYWTALSNSHKKCVFPLPKWPLISDYGSVTQSSTVFPISVEEDAEQVFSGNIGNYPANHTKQENDPWWQVDLENRHIIHQVRVFNRLDDVVERIANLAFFSSDDGETWTEFYSKRDGIPFGGADGTPLIWTSDEGIPLRFLKIVVLGNDTYLHFTQIQIYGNRVA